MWIFQNLTRSLPYKVRMTIIICINNNLPNKNLSKDGWRVGQSCKIFVHDLTLFNQFNVVLAHYSVVMTLYICRTITISALQTTKNTSTSELLAMLDSWCKYICIIHAQEKIFCWNYIKSCGLSDSSNILVDTTKFRGGPKGGWGDFPGEWDDSPPPQEEENIEIFDVCIYRLRALL